MSHPVAIAHDNVRPTARGERPDRPAGRLGAPGQGPLVKRASGRFTFLCGKHVPGAVSEALAVLELPELARGGDLDVRVRAHPEAPAGLEEGSPRKDAVAEIGLGDRAEA